MSIPFAVGCAVETVNNDRGSSGGAGTDAPDDSEDAGTGGNSSVGEESWATLHSELITAGDCANAYCHGSPFESPASMHAAIVDQVASGLECEGQGTLVVAGDAGSSLLIAKLQGTHSCGEAMPDPGADLTNRLRAWIDAGAPEN